ncbi:MAG: hypothetical protein FWD23_10040 [Oscillospiraceae bacterium]|nr:hypothetical protein [Oscillospiraceae bacterium]
MNKKIYMFFAVLLFSGILFSCGDNQAGGKEDNHTKNNIENEAPGEITGEPEKLLPDLPDMDFGGYEFRIYSPGPVRVEWESRDIGADEETGEPINDAVYARNRYVENKYNFNLVNIPAVTADMSSVIRKSVSSGDDAYDAVVPHMFDQVNFAGGEYFTDLKKIPYLDLSKPWWDQRANIDLTIGNRLLFTVGDLFIMDNDATWLIIFNKKLIADLAMENPYDIVRSGKWTFDKFLEMSTGISRDLNGDGIMDRNDFFGNIQQGENMSAYYLAAGEKYVKKDADDMPFVDMATERSISVINKIFDLMYDLTVSINHWDINESESYYITQAVFENNQALFKNTALQLVIRMRSMETNFGIVPMPKFDETQQNYYHYVHPVASALSVPVTNDNLERTGIILEALAAESRYTVRPAYYAISIEGKFLRDEESIEMLDIILATRVFDLGKAFNWGNVGMVLEDMYKPKQRDFVSLYEKNEAKYEKAIAKTLEAFEKSN